MKKTGQNIICPICDKVFYAKRWNIEAPGKNYCSWQCKKEGLRRNDSQYNSFFDHIMLIPECGCWIWIKGLTNGGYGKIWVDGKTLTTHRVAWELVYGPIPEGLNVLHHCDVRSCVNPKHLFLGTNSDNIKDAFKKGRMKSPWADGGKLKAVSETKSRPTGRR